jgi:hypothetical protein
MTDFAALSKRLETSKNGQELASQTPKGFTGVMPVLAGTRVSECRYFITD